MPYLDIRELNDLIQLSNHGGIGKGIALTDCVAEEPDQLMYIKDDELILLRDMGEVLLASCEGVVGWVRREHVGFLTLASGSLPVVTPEEQIPKTVLTAPSPPPLNQATQVPQPNVPEFSPAISISTLEEPQDRSKRASGPFDFESGTESPQPSPGLSNHSMHSQDSIFLPPRPPKSKYRQSPVSNTSRRGRHGSYDSSDEVGSDSTGRHEEGSASEHNEACGTIGGLMMVNQSDNSANSSGLSSLHRTRPPQSSLLTASSSFPLPPSDLPAPPPPYDLGKDEGSEYDSDRSWDIYGDYARESMYLPTNDIASKRYSEAFSKQSDTLGLPDVGRSRGWGTGSDSSARDEGEARSRAWVSLQGSTPPSRQRGAEKKDGELNEDTLTPNQGHPWPTTPNSGKEQLTATQLRLRILADNSPKHSLPHTPPSTHPQNAGQYESPPILLPYTTPLRQLSPAEIPCIKGSELDQDAATAESDTLHESQGSLPPLLASPMSATETTPTPPAVGMFRTKSDQSDYSLTKSGSGSMAGRSLLASPLMIEDRPEGPPGPGSVAPSSGHSSQPNSFQPQTTPNASFHSKSSNTAEGNGVHTEETTPRSLSHPKISPSQSSSAVPSPYSPLTRSFAPNQLYGSPHYVSPTGSPSLTSPYSWTPTDSPGSPHSITATQQAVDMRAEERSRALNRAVSEQGASHAGEGGRRPKGRKTTLVGRMGGDLLGAKGPVPITFLVNGEGMIPPTPTSGTPMGNGQWQGQGGRTLIGLGFPGQVRSGSPLASSSHPESPRSGQPNLQSRSVTTPIASPPMSSENGPQAGPYHGLSNAATRSQGNLSRGVRSPTPNSAPNPTPSSAPPTTRPRSRSFSSSVARTLGVGRKASVPSALSIPDVPGNPNLPGIASPIPSMSASSRKNFSSRSSLGPGHGAGEEPDSPANWVPKTSNFHDSTLSPHRAPSLNASPSSPISNVNTNSNSRSASNTNLPSVLPARIMGAGKQNKSSRGLALPSPVSHKDFLRDDDVVKMDGMNFELVGPNGRGITSSSPVPFDLPSPIDQEENVNETSLANDLSRKLTQQSVTTITSVATAGTTPTTTTSLSLRTLPLAETDEWGFIKHLSPTPEIFSGKSEGGEVRVLEGKWLSIISSPLSGSAPKKVRKLALEGIPNSLRGKVWAWFMAATLSARVPGLYGELLEHDRGGEDESIERDVFGAYPDHSIFATPNSPGQQDLRCILRAYSNFAPAGYRSEMALIAGALLIHCVAEDSFWLLSGLVNTVLKDFYGEGKGGLRIEVGVFERFLGKEEPKIAKLFRETAVKPIMFLEKWFGQLFIRCLPWPTALRVIDAVVSEGTRFLQIASLTIISLSRDRLLRLPNPTAQSVLEFLHHLPQDSLLLPGNFMKACEGKCEEKEYKKVKAGVEKDILRAS